MEKERLINDVAAGLRRMNIKPDYLICFDNVFTDDFCWDEDTICSIKVIHSNSVSNNKGHSDMEYPFHPAFNTEGDYFLEIAHFQRGFEEGN